MSESGLPFAFCELHRSRHQLFAVGVWFEGGEASPLALVDLSSSRPLYMRRFEAPCNPHVLDDGTVMVEDCGSVHTLSGTLFCLERTGDVRWKKKYRANIHASDFSPSGQLAFVSTANSPSPTHSGKTFLLDVATGAVLEKWNDWGSAAFDGERLVGVPEKRKRRNGR